MHLLPRFCADRSFQHLNALQQPPARSLPAARSQQPSFGVAGGWPACNAADQEVARTILIACLYHACRHSAALAIAPSQSQDSRGPAASHGGGATKHVSRFAGSSYEADRATLKYCHCQHAWHKVALPGRRPSRLQRHLQRLSQEAEGRLALQLLGHRRLAQQVLRQPEGGRGAVGRHDTSALLSVARPMLQQCSLSSTRCFFRHSPCRPPCAPRRRG